MCGMLYRNVRMETVDKPKIVVRRYTYISETFENQIHDGRSHPHVCFALIT